MQFRERNSDRRDGRSFSPQNRIAQGRRNPARPRRKTASSGFCPATLRAECQSHFIDRALCLQRVFQHYLLFRFGQHDARAAGQQSRPP